jgi:hypothetical protein
VPPTALPDKGPIVEIGQIPMYTKPAGGTNIQARRGSTPNPIWSLKKQAVISSDVRPAPRKPATCVCVENLALQVAGIILKDSQAAA